MRHLKNRSLGKCLKLYQFANVKLFHPEWRNFYQTDTRFLDTGEKFIFLISRFEIVPFFNLTHAWSEALDGTSMYTKERLLTLA